MNIFSKKEEKNKVGRPKLADTDLKKKSLIISGVMLLVVICLVIGGMFSLNIIPSFHKMKGQPYTSCTSIPLKYQPKSEDNPEGLHEEYGFTDVKFYSAVIGSVYHSDTYCNSVEPEDLARIESIYAQNYGITSTNGIEYLTGLKSLIINNDLGGEYNQIKSINLRYNTLLERLELKDNNLTGELDLSNNPNLNRIHVSNNNITGELDLSDKNMDYIYVDNNKISSIKLPSTPIKGINVANNQLSGSLTIIADPNDASYMLNEEGRLISSSTYDYKYVDVSNNNLTDLTIAGFVGYGIYAHNNSLNNVTLDNNITLSLGLANNNLSNVNLGVQSLNLEILSLSNNNLTSLESLDRFTNLEQIDLSNNKFTGAFNLSDKDKIKVLFLNNNNFTSAKIENLPNVYSSDFTINNNNLTEITLDNVGDNMENIDLSHNNLSKIKIVNMSPVDSWHKLNLNLSYNNLTSLDENTLITDKEKIENMNLSHNNLTGVLDLGSFTNIYSDGDPDFDLSYNNLTGVKFAPDISIADLNITHNKLTELNITGYKGFNSIDASDNNIEGEVKLDDYSDVQMFIANNNNITSFDLSGINIISGISFDNNPILNTKYILKGSSEKYNLPIRLHEEYEKMIGVDGENIISYEEDTLKGLEVGTAVLNLDSSRIYAMNSEIYNKAVRCFALHDSDFDKYVEECGADYVETFKYSSLFKEHLLSKTIKVYDVTSDKYPIDKKAKEIDAKGKIIDPKDINILDGLTVEINDDKLIIKDGDTVADTFKIINTPKNNNNSNTNSNSSSNKNNNETTMKKATSQRKNSEPTVINDIQKDIINKIIKKTTDKKKTVKEEKNKKCCWCWWLLLLLLIIIIGYIIYKKNKKEKDLS